MAEGVIRMEKETGKHASRTETLERKFIVTFSAMFLVPLLAAVYLFGESASGAPRSPAQVVLFAFSVILLGAAGFLAIRSVAGTLLQAMRDAEAVANGDISRRMSPEGTSEIHQLANHFNRVIARLQQTVESLRASRRLTNDLLAQVCTTGSAPGDMTAVFDSCLKTLLSITGFSAGVMFIVSPDGRTMRARVATGLAGVPEGATIPVGQGVAGRVASTGEMKIVSESTPRDAGDMNEFEKSLSCSLHVPMTAAGRTRGVISIGSPEGRMEVSDDDVQAIRSLANQVAVALENAELKRKEEKTYVETVAALAAAVEARDKYTRGHSRRVTDFSVAIAQGMGKPAWFVKDLESAALLHDIGKIGFPDEILRNTGPVPPDGVPMIRNHPIMGENILKPVGSLGRLCAIVRHHHERFDGTGYPDGLKGEEIPLASRMISVADSYDAMISGRRYMPNRETAEAVAELVRCSGTQFDPACVDVFLGYLGNGSGAGVPHPN
jgi:HAMP domain-containing protein